MGKIADIIVDISILIVSICFGILSLVISFAIIIVLVERLGG